MKVYLTAVLALVVLMVVTAVGYILGVGETLELRANEELIVIQDPIHPSVGDNVIRRLRIGEALPVLGCEDFKSDFLVRVDLGGGRFGYVGAGKYGLKRSPASIRTFFREPSRLVMTCRGLLLHRTVD